MPEKKITSSKTYSKCLWASINWDLVFQVILRAVHGTQFPSFIANIQIHYFQFIKDKENLTIIHGANYSRSWQYIINSLIHNSQCEVFQ